MHSLREEHKLASVFETKYLDVTKEEVGEQFTILHNEIRRSPGVLKVVK